MNHVKHIFLATLLLPVVVVAHVPYLVTQHSSDDAVTLPDAEVSRVYYGSMTGQPHSYWLELEEPQEFRMGIQVPANDTATNNISGLILQDNGSGKRVTEIAVLPAKAAAWEEFYEPFGADTYRQGPQFEGVLQPGTYRIEISTPTNMERYALSVGEKEDFSEVGYFETIRRIAAVKEWAGKSTWRVLESPLVYGPLIGIVLLGLGAYFGYRAWRKRR